MSELLGKVALVTGASRGIGRAIAVALAHAGCDLAVNYHERNEDARETLRKVEAEGRKGVLVQADVSRAGEVLRLAETIERALGPIDVVVNNTGQSRPLSLDAIGIEEFDAALAVNLRSAFLVTQAVLAGMRARRWGRIIFISSVAAQLGGVVGPHYAASKAGLVGLAHSYAALLAKEGITVNVIAPALIETEMVRVNSRARPDLIPVGRFGRPDEVAQVVVSVAANGYLTGQTFNVNGGWYMS
jgi:3-oxoacyl-[acyl-carrier protein] reductase